MQQVLIPWKEEHGQIIFEYDIPRLGKRIDVVLLMNGSVSNSKWANKMIFRQTSSK